MQNAKTYSGPAQTKRNQHYINLIISEAYGWLLDSVRSMVPRYEDAEDIVQDVFHRFVSGYDQLRSLESSSAWLYQTARNRVSDFYRKRARTLEGSRTSLGSGDFEKTLLLEELLQATEATPEQNFDLDYLKSRLEQAIEHLPEAQRAVFIWHEIEGLSFRDIAALTGESQNTLLSRKHYAVLALRKHLQDLYH